MELNGIPLARSARMNDLPIASTPSRVTPPSALDAAAPSTEEARPQPVVDDGLDKYDISTIACTD
jgi:hypothetical protein